MKNPIVSAFVFLGVFAGLAGCAHSAAPATLPAVQSIGEISRLTNDHGYEQLHAFSGGNTDGSYPNGGLISANGALYGTTAGGGIRNEGTVYESSLTGNVNVIYDFGEYESYGTDPDAPVTMSNGTLYGTTASGGYGVGSVYSINSSGRESTLYTFYPSGGDGANPYGGLLVIGNTLYGTTYDGGSYGDGTVFEITVTSTSSGYGYGQETVLHSFGASSGDGANPYAGLIAYQGTLYGVTYSGGTGDEGTVFSITTSGTEKVMYSFGSKSGDGANPRGALLHFRDRFYGTTANGGTSGDGTVYSITRSGHESVLHSFTGPPDGVMPIDQLSAVDGVLYGTTYDGGSGGCGSTNGCGTIFEITKSGREHVLYSFTSNPDGAHPWAGVVAAKGGLYGTATLGGKGVGTIFRISH
jgi:uncharacterized repeat protein (TIGR03803 family)